MQIVKAFDANVHYVQSMQNQQVKFSFVNRDGDEVKEIFPSVLCRDYLGDALFAEESKTPNPNVYGFQYNPAVSKLDRDKTRLSLDLGTADGRVEDFLNNKEILLEVSRANEFEDTEFILVKNKGHLLVEADSLWMGTNYMMSFFTFLLKIMAYKFKDPMNWKEEIKTHYGTESHYFEMAGAKKFDYLSKNLNKICDPYHGVTGLAKGAPIMAVHGSTGFLHICTGGGGFSSNLYAKKAQELWTNFNK